MRKVATADAVEEAVRRLEAEGVPVTVEGVIALTGGSKTTVRRELEEFKNRLALAVNEPLAHELRRVADRFLTELAATAVRAAKDEWRAERADLLRQLEVARSEAQELEAEFRALQAANKQLMALNADLKEDKALLADALRGKKGAPKSKELLPVPVSGLLDFSDDGPS